MLVAIKNTALYQLWYNYYDAFKPEMKGYEKRTYAYFNSNKGIYPPC